MNRLVLHPYGENEKKKKDSNRHSKWTLLL